MRRLLSLKQYPLINLFQLTSTPVPRGVTNPNPVTTTRLGNLLLATSPGGKIRLSYCILVSQVVVISQLLFRGINEMEQ